MEAKEVILAPASRWSLSDRQTFAVGALILAGIFVLACGVGMTNIAVGGLGVAVAVLGPLLIVMAGLRSSGRDFLYGTAHVHEVSPLPAAGTVGRCELELLVNAHGINGVPVRVRDPAVPVSKWPDIGAALPIMVDANDPRQVRILWDEVQTHRQVEFDDGLYADLDLEEPAPNGPGSARADRRYEEPGYDDRRYEERHHDERGYEERGYEEPGPAAQPAGDRGYPEADLLVDDAPTLSNIPPVPVPRSPEPARYSTEAPPQPDSDPVGVAQAAFAPVSPSPAPAGSAVPAPAPAEPVIAPEPVRPSVDPDIVVPPTPPEVDEEPAEIDQQPSRPAASQDRHLEFDLIDPRSAGTYGTRPRPAATVPPVAAVPPAPAVPAPRTGGAGDGAGVSVTLIVSDLDRSRAFYRDLLGLEEIDSGRSAAVLAFGDARVVLRQVADMPPIDRRLAHLNLDVPDVQEAYERLRAKGVEFVHRPRVVQQGEHLQLCSATFRDPDGHAIAITRWMVRR